MKIEFEFRGHILFELVRLRIIESFLNYLKINKHLYRHIDIFTESLPTWHPKLRSEDSEDNIYIYIIKKATQLLERIMKISTVKDFSRTASCSINDNIDCMTQCKKFSNEKMRISRSTDCEKGQTQLETFH